MSEEEIARLVPISRSRSEPASWVERARMLVAYSEMPSFFAVGQRLGVHHQTAGVAAQRGPCEICTRS